MRQKGKPGFEKGIGLFLAHALKKLNPLHNRTYIQVSQLAAAVGVGLLAYLYAELIATTHTYFMRSYESHPYAVALGSSFLFVAATWLVMGFAPSAGGSGIPQVLSAIQEAHPGNSKALSSPLVSLRTAGFKVLSTTLGILGGASIGREGPTVQIASSIFAFAGRYSGRFFGLKDFRSFLVAGGAAGIAAAFNTPLAGITFALEEIAHSFFAEFKSVVMLSVIVGGITAQALGGNYLYFGHPSILNPVLGIFPAAFFIGVFGGLFGGLFALILSRTHRFMSGSWPLRALVCGLVCGVFCLLSHGDTSGSGYETTRKFMDDAHGTLPAFFFLEKLMTTIFSYLSGMAGGIFSPSLSIGAGMGFSLGELLQATDLKACALIGMVAFFSGAVQASLTAVVIIMEMTDQHMLIIPFLVAAFLAQGVGKLVLPTPLYRVLALKITAEKGKV